MQESFCRQQYEQNPTSGPALPDPSKLLNLLATPRESDVDKEQLASPCPVHWLRRQSYLNS